MCIVYVMREYVTTYIHEYLIYFAKNFKLKYVVKKIGAFIHFTYLQSSCSSIKEVIKSASLGAWKCNFPAF